MSQPQSSQPSSGPSTRQFMLRDVLFLMVAFSAGFAVLANFGIGTVVLVTGIVLVGVIAGILRVACWLGWQGTYELLLGVAIAIGSYHAAYDLYATFFPDQYYA